VTELEQPGFDVLRFTTAAEYDVSTAVPRLAGGAFAQLSWPG
jgi:hypothetical protein